MGGFGKLIYIYELSFKYLYSRRHIHNLYYQTLKNINIFWTIKRSTAQGVPTSPTSCDNKACLTSYDKNNAMTVYNKI